MAALETQVKKAYSYLESKLKFSTLNVESSVKHAEQTIEFLQDAFKRKKDQLASIDKKREEIQQELDVSMSETIQLTKRAHEFEAFMKESLQKYDDLVASEANAQVMVEQWKGKYKQADQELADLLVRYNEAKDALPAAQEN